MPFSHSCDGDCRGYRREAPSKHPGVGSGRAHRQPDERRVSDAAARRRHLQLGGRRHRLFRGRIYIERRLAGADDRLAAKAERAAARRRLSQRGGARDLHDQPVLAPRPGLRDGRGSERRLGGVAAPPSRRLRAMPRPNRRTLRVRFWGTRGSLPAPLRERSVRGKIRDALLAARGRALETRRRSMPSSTALPFSVRGTFGGNTSCVEIITGSDEYVLCDLGTGVREFGNHVLREHGPGRKHCFNIFLSHPHWDHIMGFPFFAPAYIPGNRIRIYGCHEVLSEALHTQQSSPVFSGRFSFARRDDRVRHARARPHLRDRRSFRHLDQAISHRRFLRLPLFAGRQVDRLFDRLRAQIFQSRRILPIRRVLPKRRSADLRCHVLVWRHGLGQGGLGPFEQCHRGRAGAGGAGQAARPVSSRAGLRRPDDRGASSPRPSGSSGSAGAATRSR